jgi:hypothetical protein
MPATPNSTKGKLAHRTIDARRLVRHTMLAWNTGRVQNPMAGGFVFAESIFSRRALETSVLRPLEQIQVAIHGMVFTSICVCKFGEFATRTSSANRILVEVLVSRLRATSSKVTARWARSKARSISFKDFGGALARGYTGVVGVRGD